MATPQARREALGPLGTRLLQLIPGIAFVSAILISTFTFPQPMRWIVHVFFYGESGARLARLEAHHPPLVQFTDGHGRGHYERMADSKWSTLLHVLPGKYSLLMHTTRN